MSTTAIDQTVARIIRSQVPFGVWARIGARDFGYSEDSLGFTITDAGRRRVRVNVILTPADLYRVTWHPLAGRRAFDPPQEIDGIFAFDLWRVLDAICERTAPTGWRN